MNIYKWLNIRKIILIGILIDIALLECFIIFSNDFIFGSNSKQFKTITNIDANILFLFSWIFLSYICERYSNLENKSLKNTGKNPL